MFKIQGPHPSYQVTIVLPSPDWRDTVGLRASINDVRTMDGKVYTYVKDRGGRKRYQWNFRLSRHKAMELRAFLKIYFSHKLKTIDHNGEVRIGWLMNNPFEYTGSGRAFGFPGGETMEITLEFEEVD